MTGSAQGQTVVWDTVNTGTMRLAVSNHGSMGLNGIGGVNMGFASSGSDCDPTADVYLYTGGLFVIQEVEPDVTYKFSTGMYQMDESSEISFKPDITGPLPSHFVGPDGSDAFYTGRFLNWDSTIGMERTYYAPTTGPPNDNFIVVRTDIYSMDGNAHENLLIGEAIDWDIPSNPAGQNRSWECEGRVRGVQLDSTDICNQNVLRSGFGRILGAYTSQDFSQNACVNYGSGLLPYGSNWTNHLLPTLANSADGGFLPSAAWDSLRIISCHPAFADTGNLYEFLSYAHVYTLQPDDTLTVFLALESEKTNTTSGQFGESGLIKPSMCWYKINIRQNCRLYTCCDGRRGNIDGDGGVDIADLTCLIDYLFVSFHCLYCVEEGNLDGDGGIDIADLMFLIDHLFINFPPMPSCPMPCNDSFAEEAP